VFKKLDVSSVREATFMPKGISNNKTLLTTYRKMRQFSSQNPSKVNAALITYKVLTGLLEIYLEIYKIPFLFCLSGLAAFFRHPR